VRGRLLIHRQNPASSLSCASLKGAAPSLSSSSSCLTRRMESSDTSSESVRCSVMMCCSVVCSVCVG
jgi:hypothetical protein